MNNKFQTTTDRSNMFYWQSDRPFDGKETREIFMERHQRFDENIAKRAIQFGMQRHGKSESDAQVVEVDLPINSGSVNSVSKARLQDGTKVILRAHPDNIPNGYFWVEKIATVKATQAGVPTYQTFCIYDEKKEFSFDFMLIEQVKGLNVSKELTLTPKMDEKFTAQTGKYAALINSVKTTKYGFFDNHLAKTESKLVGIHEKWKNHLLAALEPNLKYLQDKQVLTSDQRQQLEQVFTNHEALMKCESPRLIHNDIADWNQLADSEGNVIAMIDWDECFSGDPVMEFAAYSLFYDEPRLTWFRAGYESISKLGEDFEEKFHLYKTRYIISKLHLRKVKLEDHSSVFLQDKLDFGLKCLNDELKWYGN